MQPLEDAKELVRVAHVEARAVVAHEPNVALPLLLTTNLDHRGLALARVFEGVRQEVQPHLAEQRRIAQARRQFADAHFDLPSYPLGAEVFEDASHEWIGMHGLFVQRRATEPRKGEQVINEHPHFLRTLPDRLQVAPAFLGQQRRVVIQHRLRKSIHGAQGRTQIVRDRIGERFELLVRGLELCGALDHALLQIPVESLDFPFRLLHPAHVRIRPAPAQHAARGILQRKGAREEPAVAAIRRAQWEIHFKRLAGGDRGLPAFDHRRQHFRIMHPLPAPSLHLLRRGARVVEPPLIIPIDEPIGFRNPRELRNRVHHRAELLLTFPHRRVRQFAFGDVHPHSHHRPLTRFSHGERHLGRLEKTGMSRQIRVRLFGNKFHGPGLDDSAIVRPVSFGLRLV